MDPEDVANCQFVPISAIKKAMDFIDTPKSVSHDICKRNLVKLQKQTLFGKASRNVSILKDKYQRAVYNAIYSHDWNKLLYLLKKNPIWQHSTFETNGKKCYIRALAILMMFHPDAQSQNMLQEYIHMVCSCRTTEEKRALLKLLLSLEEKIVEKPRVYPYQYKKYI